MLGKILKNAARGYYKAKTAPLQAASLIANVAAPKSKIAEGLKKAARPFKKGGVVKKYKGGGIALRGLGKAFTKKKK